MYKCLCLCLYQRPSGPVHPSFLKVHIASPLAVPTSGVPGAHSLSFATPGPLPVPCLSAPASRGTDAHRYSLQAKGQGYAPAPRLAALARRLRVVKSALFPAHFPAPRATQGGALDDDRLKGIIGGDPCGSPRFGKQHQFSKAGQIHSRPLSLMTAQKMTFNAIGQIYPGPHSLSPSIQGENHGSEQTRKSFSISWNFRKCVREHDARGKSTVAVFQSQPATRVQTGRRVQTQQQFRTRRYSRGDARAQSGMAIYPRTGGGSHGRDKSRVVRSSHTTGCSLPGREQLGVGFISFHLFVWKRRRRTSPSTFIS